MPRRSSQSEHAAPPLSSYALAASRTALSLIVSEASDGASGIRAGTRGFEAVERSASEALLDIFTRYMRGLGLSARAAAQHAGRSECNIADMLAGLRASGAEGGMLPKDLLAFLEEAPEAAFPCNLSATFPVPRPPLPTAGASGTAGAEARPAHIPDFLPPFPEKRTYSHTATHNSRATDGPAAKKRRAKHRRQAQESLLSLAEAQDGDGAAATIGICPPPPPLPALPGEDEEAIEAAIGSGAQGAQPGEGAMALASVPDVLAASFPGVLQSSARLETSGCATTAPFGLPTAPASTATNQAAAAAAVATSHPRQLAILNLKHENGLDVIDGARS